MNDALDVRRADIDHGRPGRHHVRADQSGDAGRDDQHLRVARMMCQVARLFVRRDDGRVFAHHQQRHRQPDDVRAADHARAHAAQRPVRAALEQQHHRRRRRGHEFVAGSEREPALIDRVRTVDVLVRRNRIRDAPDREMRRQRLLQDDAVDRRIVAQRREPRAYHALIGGAIQRIDGHIDADLLPDVHQAAHVRKRCRIFADDGDDEPRSDPCCTECGATGAKVGPQLACECPSVEKASRHRPRVRSLAESPLDCSGGGFVYEHSRFL